MRYWIALLIGMLIGGLNQATYKAEVAAAWEYVRSLPQRVKMLESQSDKMDESFTTLKFLGGLIVGILILLECVAIWLSIG